MQFDLRLIKWFDCGIGGVAREVEGTALEMRHGVNPIVSSNLTPSAFGRRSDLRRTQSAKVAKETFAKMYYIYLLKCSDDKPYTGCTSDLKERLERHQKGQVPATAGRLPVKLISYTVIADKYKAFEFEKYLKSGSGRAFIKKHFI